ncbi:MAG: phosphatase PAP2 family protein [bacterium]|nr:phosphatase PAP2 family protein [bacterium]
MDQSIFLFIHGLAEKNRFLDWAGILLADYLAYFLILGAVYFIFVQKEWRRRYYIFSFTLLTLVLSRGLLTEIIRYFYYRPRPFIALDFTPLINHDTAAAFPSGHAAVYFALALSVFYLINRTWGWWFLAAALLMGLARVFVGVHWPLDILGGLVVALISFFVVKRLFRGIDPTHNCDLIPKAVKSDYKA